MLKISHTEGSHKCISHKEGDWIIFTCPICEDYEHRINRVTGETICHNDFTFPKDWDTMSFYEKEFFLNSQPKHHGVFIPVGIDANLYNPN